MVGWAAAAASRVGDLLGQGSLPLKRSPHEGDESRLLDGGVDHLLCQFAASFHNEKTCMIIVFIELMPIVLSITTYWHYSSIYLHIIAMCFWGVRH